MGQCAPEDSISQYPFLQMIYTAGNPKARDRNLSDRGRPSKLAVTVTSESAVGGNHLPESLSGPCRCLRYHELTDIKVSKGERRTEDSEEPLAFFHTIDIIFIPLSVFSYLQFFIPLGCDFIPKLFNFIPLDGFFHALGIAISYLL
jgi:hypothetical protein